MLSSAVVTVGGAHRLAAGPPGAPREAGPAAATRASTRPAVVRPAVLGIAIERDEADGRCRVVRVAAHRDVLFEGDLGGCEVERVRRLEREHGTGNVNLPVVTLGGQQLWADRAVLADWRVQEHVWTGHCRLLDPGEVRRAWGSFAACRTALEGERVRARLRPRSERLVVLLHGLGRTRRSMRRVVAELERCGYDAMAVGYPSSRRSIAAHADQLEEVLAQAHGFCEVSFVTHSLGGLVARELLSRPGAAWRDSLAIGKLVMLAPPNRGSRIAAALVDSAVYGLATGAVGRELARGGGLALPSPPCPVGVIAGGNGTERGKNPFLGGDNDGVVLVENTRLDGAADFLLVDAWHTTIMDDARVLRATARFLREGRFERR